MPVKPDTPITRKEMYLDVATGGSLQLPSPVTREEKYLAKIAGESVDIPTPVTRYEMLLAAVTGESYTLTPVTRLEVYLAKAAGQGVDVPQPITREEMYWFDYVGGQPTPSEQEYTGAVPVTFIANGQPLLDYLISGNAVQSGTPTPDNPIMPQGTGERTGNLFDKSTARNGYYIDDADGREKYQPGYVGVLSASDYIDIANASNIFITNTSRSRWGAFYDSSKTYVSGFNGYGSKSVPPTARYVRITVPNANFGSMMLNLGSEPLPYEPYGYKIPISSASTTTPVYLGEVETERKINKLVLTGQERWYKSAAYRGSFYLGSVSPEPISLTEQAYCSHAEFTSISTYAKNKFCFNGSPINLNLWIGESSWTTDDFKAYLAQQYTAGTPVTVWYVLAEPETGIVNEPLMKIGDYADTLSMEQAGVEIPTVNGSNTLDMLTTVKPSEVYIKYKGEPVAGSQTSLQSSAYAPAEVSSQSESIDDINSSLLGKDEET